MHIHTTIAALFSLGLYGASIQSARADDAASTAPVKQASISFASHNISTWEANGEKGIWVQATGRQWYYAEFMSPCTGVQFRNSVGFKFGPAGELDRWGAVLVPHFPQCFFKSFTLSAGPNATRVPAPAAAPPVSQPSRLPSTSPRV